MSACTEVCNKPTPFSRLEHCRVCHQTFAATAAGDSHRTGEHGVSRRCRTTDEMLAGGMWTTTNTEGGIVWHGKWSESGVQKRWSGPGSSAGAN